MTKILRWGMLGLLTTGFAASSIASWKGYGIQRLSTQTKSIRNQSVLGPWFNGRGYRGGK